MGQRLVGQHEQLILLLAHLLGGPPGQARRPAALLERRPRYPVLGICMGLQALNVAAGGTLVQDIPAEFYGIETYEELTRSAPEQLHRNPWYHLDPAGGLSPGVVHGVRFSAAPKLWSSIHPPGGPVQVVSAHHQSVERPGAGLEVIATSADGRVVEALRHTRYRRVLGVQFHPERDALFSPGTSARRRPDDTVRNQFAAAMNADPRSAEFHRGLRRVLGRWVAQEGAGRGGRP